MSVHAVKLPWGDGDYLFLLRWGELRALQVARDAGPDLIAQRLRTIDCQPDDIHETIRLGLIGAGMKQSDALVLVRKFVENLDVVNWDDNRLLAWAIINYSLRPPKDEKALGKAVGARRKKKATGSQDEKSPSPESTVSGPQ